MLSVSDFTSVINQLLPEPQAGLLSGILFGIKADLSPELYQDLVTTGTLHIVALSGMNITIITNILNKILLRVVSRRAACSITILAITGFIVFVGPSASIIRAGIMGSLTLVGIITGRPRLPLFLWGLAVGGMLIARPLWITDLSFQLSALASLGIILFAKEKEERHRPFVLAVLYEDLRTTLAAQAGTIPLIFFAFHRISLIAPLANVLIGWTIPIITVLGMCVALFGWIWLPLGQVIAWVTWLFLEYLIIMIELTGNVPVASVGW